MKREIKKMFNECKKLMDLHILFLYFSLEPKTGLE